MSQKSLSFWTIFCLLPRPPPPAPNNPENQHFEKMKKKKEEKSIWRCHHFKLALQKT